MKKKPAVLLLPKPKTISQPDDRHWQNGGDLEIHLYARSLHKAAKTLIATLDLKTCEVWFGQHCKAIHGPLFNHGQ